MMTALQIEHKQGKGLSRILTALRRNRIRVEHRYCDTAAVKCVTYEQYRRRVNWASIDRFVKSQRGQVLCDRSLALPEDSGYRRFESSALNERLCENAALTLLGKLRDRRVRVVLMDSGGEHLPLCRYLCDVCDVPDIVTEAVEPYLNEADNLLSDKGAVLRVHRCRDILEQADIVIAPGVIADVLSVRHDALIFTGAAPLCRQNCDVIHEYYIELPRKYAAIKPDFLDDGYFAGALYAMSCAHELGSYNPRYCSDGVTIHTMDSILLLARKKIRRC